MSAPLDQAERDYHHARTYWRQANELASAAWSWGLTTRAGRSHTIAAAALYGLSAAICERQGVNLVKTGSGRALAARNALQENALTLVREAGPEFAADTLYALADAIATGVDLKGGGS